MRKKAWDYLNPDTDYGEITDSRDGQTYKTVTIGTQTWMAENLNYNLGDDSGSLNMVTYKASRFVFSFILLVGGGLHRDSVTNISF